MLSMNGNTAPYMLYAFVRIKGIQRKAAESISMHADAKLVLQQSEEISLAKHILRFEEVLKEIEADLYPNKVLLDCLDLTARMTIPLALRISFRVVSEIQQVL